MNTTEKAMSILNIAWTNARFSFPLGDILPKWFWRIIEGASSMTQVCREISEYDEQYQQVLLILERRQQRSAKIGSNKYLVPAGLRDSYS